MPGSLGDDLFPAADSPVVDAGSVGHLLPDSIDLDGDGNTVEPLPRDIAGTSRSLGAEARPDMGAYDTALDAAATVDVRTGQAATA